MRSPVWVLTWLAVAGLGGFLIAVASGLISDKVGPPPATLAVSPGAAPAWGPPSSYLGKYHLRVRLPAVKPAAHHSGGTTTRGVPQFQPASGELTTFLRVVKHGEPLAASGILALSGSTGSELVYMTDLTSDRGVLRAEINGGAYLGPVIGSFTGFRNRGTIVGILVLAGSRPAEISLSRYSRSSPNP